MMKSFYFGGQFQFRYKDYSEENIAKDYRSRILGDYRLWLNKGKNLAIEFNDKAAYIGPYYFGDYKSSRYIVNTESDSIFYSTDCFFVLSNESAPGTITEIIQAVFYGKDIHIFYVRKDIPTEEVDTDIKSDLWYPITFAMQNSQHIEVHGYDTYEEAADACVERFKELTK